VLPLRRKADLHNLLRHGQRTYGPWAVLHARQRGPAEPGPPLPRLAISTLGKFPNTVLRNRARRLLRETCRLLLADLSAPWDLLFAVRPGILSTTFPERQSSIASLLCRAGVPEFTLSAVQGPAVSCSSRKDPAHT